MRFMIALALAVVAPCSWALSVEVIVDDNVRLTNLEAARRIVLQDGGSLSVYSYSDVDSLEAALGEGVPKSEAEAKVWLEDRVQSIGEERLGKMAVAAYQAHILSIKYQLDRYPAIVVNGEAVLYGLTDVQEAVERYIDWHSRQ